MEIIDQLDGLARRWYGQEQPELVEPEVLESVL